MKFLKILRFKLAMRNCAALAQRGGYNQLGGRDIGANGAQPRAEGVQDCLSALKVRSVRHEQTETAGGVDDGN
jgi:hypothetical protein